MILLIAIVIGLAATYLRARLYNRTLTFPKLRVEWLVFVAVIPQILIFQIPSLAARVPMDWIPSVQIVTMSGLVLFALANLKAQGIWVMGIGLLSNLAVIMANSGWMPISPDTLVRLHPEYPGSMWIVGERLGYTKDMILTHTTSSLQFLSDRFILPDWFSYKVAFSLGDIFISIGAVILLLSLSNKEKETK